MITLTALIARGHHEELAMHLRAARTNGLTDDEIKEVILQSAIYCGVPDANTAFRVAQTVSRRNPSDRGAALMTHHTGEPPTSTPRCGRRSAGSTAALSGVRPDDLAATAMRGVLATAAGPGPRRTSATSSGATPTAPARTTATSAGWPCCWPGCRSSVPGHDGQPAVRLQPRRGDDRLADDRVRRRRRRAGRRRGVDDPRAVGAAQAVARRSRPAT